MTQSVQDFSEQLADTVHTRSQHVLRIEGRPNYASSGIAWSRDGYIVTASYAVEFESPIMIGLPNGERVSAELVGRDAGTDIAMLKVDGVELNAPVWTNSEGLRLGNMVMVLARPGRTARSAMGTVSTLSGGWKTPYGGHLDRYIQTDCLTRPGFSGGLVVDVYGMTVGLITSGLLHRDHIVVPVPTIRDAVERILKNLASEEEVSDDADEDAGAENE